MTVTIVLPNGTDELHNIASFDPLPGGLRLRQSIAEEKSASGLIARVGGRSRFIIYPWHRVLKVEVEE
jgi:hypothetical protein